MFYTAKNEWLIPGRPSKESGGWDDLGVTHTGVEGPRDGEDMGVREAASVIRARKLSTCLWMRALCSVSRGLTLGTRHPSIPVNHQHTSISTGCEKYVHYANFQCFNCDECKFSWFLQTLPCCSVWMYRVVIWENWHVLLKSLTVLKVISMILNSTLHTILHVIIPKSSYDFYMADRLT